MHQAPRRAKWREAAYQFAILACVGIITLITVAIMLAWVGQARTIGLSETSPSLLVRPSSCSLVLSSMATRADPSSELKAYPMAQPGA